MDLSWRKTDAGLRMANDDKYGLVRKFVKELRRVRDDDSQCMLNMFPRLPSPQGEGSGVRSKPQFAECYKFPAVIIRKSTRSLGPRDDTGQTEQVNSVSPLFDHGSDSVTKVS